MKIIAILIAIIAAVAGYGIYTGHRSSNEAIEHAMTAARSAGLSPTGASITKYVTRGSTTYTCGAVHLASADGAPALRLFVVLQTGWLLDHLGTHLQGEKTFAPTYAEHCI